MRDPPPPGVPSRDTVGEYLRDRHATTEQFARCFFAGATAETARKSASRWLLKQRRRRRVRVAGTVLGRHTGRAALVYGPPCRPDLLEHQVWVTEAELLLGVEFERDAPLGTTTADGVFEKDGHRFAVEVDNASKQSRRQYRQKWAKYGRFEGFILVLCHIDARLRAGRPWVDWTGATAEV